MKGILKVIVVIIHEFWGDVPFFWCNLYAAAARIIAKHGMYQRTSKSRFVFCMFTNNIVLFVFSFRAIMIHILKQLDIQLFWLINAHNSPALDVFFGILTWLGNGWVAIPLVIAAVLARTPRTMLRHVTILGVISLTLSGQINSEIKRIVHRDRPLTSLSSPGSSQAQKVHAIGEQLHYRSFPSGHANTAFSCAAFLFILYGRWWALCFVPAFVVGYSRVYVGAHFPIDVAAGAVLGVCIVFLTERIYRALVPGYAPGAARGPGQKVP
jgi:undecaprenyl-diphosphatase